MKVLPRRGGELERAELTGEFTTHFATLRAGAEDLRAASLDLEKQFLTTGTELEALSSAGDRFVKLVETLVVMATGKDADGSVFASAIQLIEAATHFLVQCAEQTEHKHGLLKDYHLQVTHLLAVETELQRTLLPLKFMKVLFKSESAPLGPEVQQMFGSLTEETELLELQVREIFGTKFKQLEQTQRAIGDVMTQVARQAQSLHEITTVHRARIESSLEILKKEMVTNQAQEVRLGILSKDVAREVGQIVMGLQFQDIVSQKLQHVTAALPQIEAKFAEFGALSDPKAASAPLQFLQLSCRVEAAQLQTAQEELVKVETTINDGIQKVLSHLTEMDSKCLSLEEFKLLTTSFDGMVQELVETIGEVRTLVAGTVASATEAYEMLKPLGGLASDLTATVREMSARNHLIGLNAQIKAAHVASDRRGGGLEVLSSRTSEICCETNRISEAAAVQLDALAVGLHESVQAFEKLRSASLSQESILNDQGRTEEQQLHAFRDRALESLRSIGDALDEIRAQAQQTQAAIHFTEFHLVTLPALRTPLVAIADTAGRWLHAHGFEITHESAIEGLKKEYTMASEREVFADVVASARGTTPLPSPPSSTAVADDGLELFTDFSETAEVAIPVVTAAKTEPVTTGVTSAGGANLGDNIELF